MPQTENYGTISTYFSHSYRDLDRDLNEFFWTLLSEYGFAFSVDPKSDILSIPYLEKMMKVSSCFVAVAPLRREQEHLRCSPFIVFEYGLAVQAQKPRLIFVEGGVSKTCFPDQGDVCDFDRTSMHDEEQIAQFKTRIAAFAKKSSAHRRLNVGQRGKVGLVLAHQSSSDDVHRRAVWQISKLLRKAAYEPEELALVFETNYQFALNLDECEFLIIDVGSTLPAWVFPFVHGRFVPTIKILYLPTLDSSSINLSPLVTGQLIQGMGSTDNSVIFWRDEDELLGQLTKQISKFDQDRLEFRTPGEGIGYFRSLGRGQHYVFVSCAHDLDDFSMSLSRKMKLENIEHFHYVNSNPISLGSDWRAKLPEIIDKAEIFLALMSKPYGESRSCQEELELAKKKKKTVIPVILGELDGLEISEHGLRVAGLPQDEQQSIILSRLDRYLREKDALKATVSTTQAKHATKSEAVIDIAIVTVMSAEYKAVLGYLDNHRPAPASKKSRNLYAWELGEIKATQHEQPYRVVLAMAGKPGTESGYQVTLATAKRWNPRYVLLVGIAGGRALDGLKKGDVVISESIWGYEYGKIDEGFEPRSNFTYRTDNSLLTAAQVFNITTPDWRSKIAVPAPENTLLPEIKVGPVASGNKVVDNAADPFFKRVIEKWPKLLVIEMEGAGAAAAIASIAEEGKSIGFTMIRGISDIPSDIPKTSAERTLDKQNPSAQTQQRDSWTQYAAESAACFTAEMIRLRWPEPPYRSRS
ncbi:MAG: TIR domain-containing protein [Thermoanaerobaculia bacterium]